MNETKPWWKSKTLWGSVAVIASAVSSIAGYPIPAEVIGVGLNQIVELVGGAFALYGRFVADKKLR